MFDDWSRGADPKANPCLHATPGRIITPISVDLSIWRQNIRRFITRHALSPIVSSGEAQLNIDLPHFVAMNHASSDEVRHETRVRQAVSSETLDEILERIARVGSRALHSEPAATDVRPIAVGNASGPGYAPPLAGKGQSWRSAEGLAQLRLAARLEQLGAHTGPQIASRFGPTVQGERSCIAGDAVLDPWMQGQSELDSGAVR
jgi:hypothetical protein